MKRGPSRGPIRLKRGSLFAAAESGIVRGALLVAIAAATLCAGAGCAVPETRRPAKKAVVAEIRQPKVRTVKLPYRTYGMARMVGEALYVSVDSGTGLIDTLLRHDVESGTSSVLFTVPADIAWIAADERWLVWESEKTLYAEPVGGGARRVLASGREVYGPTLEGDTVAWVEHQSGPEGRITTFNLKTGEKREVARTHLAEFYNNFMQLRDGMLLWTDIYEGTGHYLMHDLKTGKTREYAMPATRFRYPGYAGRSGEAVFSINFDRYDEWDWSAQQVGRYSTATGDYTPMTKGDEYVNALLVGRDAVAVIDSEQRLLFGPVNGGYPTLDLSAAWGTPIDAVQVSSDGVTAVAGCSSSEKRETRIFIFELSTLPTDTRESRESHGVPPR